MTLIPHRVTAAELAEQGKRLEALEKPRAKERQKAGGAAGGKGSGKLPEASTSDTRDKVAAALGVSGKTYEKVKQIVAADGAARSVPLSAAGFFVSCGTLTLIPHREE